MRIIIVTWGPEFPVEAGCQEPVMSIKSKIEQIIGVPVDLQTLSVHGWELLDGLDMEDYPIITEGTKINLTLTYMQPNYPAKIQIVVRFSSRQIHIEVERTETVSSLKEKIHIIEGTPIKRLSLFYSGIELEEDFRNLSEYGIREFSEVIVFLKTMSRLRDEPPLRKMHIVVQTSSTLLNAARIPLEMRDSSTVNELRQLLLAGKILPIDDYPVK